MLCLPGFTPVWEVDQATGESGGTVVPSGRKRPCARTGARLGMVGDSSERLDRTATRFPQNLDEFEGPQGTLVCEPPQLHATQVAGWPSALIAYGKVLSQRARLAHPQGHRASVLQRKARGQHQQEARRQPEHRAEKDRASVAQLSAEFDRACLRDAPILRDKCDADWPRNLCHRDPLYLVGVEVATPGVASRLLGP